MESAYGPNKAKVQKAIPGNKPPGFSTADEGNYEVETSNIGERPMGDNPNMVERAWGDVPVRVSPDCLNGNDVKGYVTVKANMRPNFNDPSKLSEK